MKKLIRFLTLALSLNAFTNLATTEAWAGKKSDKFVITFKALGFPEEDCKISIKEIAKFLTEDNSIRVCSKLTAVAPEGQELTPEGLLKLVEMTEAGQGTLKFSYEGSDANNLLETVSAWLQFLTQHQDPNYQAEAKGWSASVVSQTETEVTLKFENAETGKSVTAVVALNAVLE